MQNGKDTKGSGRKHFTTVIQWILGSILGIPLGISLLLFLRMNEAAPAEHVEDTVYAYIQAGHDTIPLTKIFAAAYDSICLLTAASEPPIDYVIHADNLLSSGQITSTQYRNLPDLADYSNYAAVFLLVKGPEVRLVPLRTNGFLAQGKLEKGDVFTFRFDDAARADTSQYHGCLPVTTALFKVDTQSGTPRLLLSQTSTNRPNTSKIIVSNGHSNEPFSFDSYRDSHTLRSAITKLFPPGTEKSYVDKILVTSGGATSRAVVDGGFTLYSHDAIPHLWFHLYLCPHDYMWQIRIYYDDKERVRDITIRGPC